MPNFLLIILNPLIGQFLSRPKTSIEKGSYTENNETGSSKTQQEQSFAFDWRLLFNNIRLGVRNTFHF
jgi:hypothetical protein